MKNRLAKCVGSVALLALTGGSIARATPPTTTVQASSEPVLVLPLQAGGRSTAASVLPPAAAAQRPVNQVVPKAGEYIITVSETPIPPEEAIKMGLTPRVQYPASALPPSNSPAVFPRAQPATARKSYVDLSASPCFAHAPDYSWIIGKVEYSTIAKEWRIRYAGVEETERYGGRLSLIENHQVGLLRDGLHVQVRGYIVNRDNAGNGPTFYRVEWFRIVDNPNVPQAPVVPGPEAVTQRR
jgi:hypothetical protein